MRSNGDYLLPGAFCLFVALAGSAIAGTSLATTPVPALVQGTNRETLAYVPNTNRSLGLAIGGLLTVSGIIAFGKVVSDGISQEELIAEASEESTAIGGDPTVLQPTLIQPNQYIDPQPTQRTIPQPITTPAVEKPLVVSEQPTVLDPAPPATVIEKAPIPDLPYLKLLLENTIVLVGFEKGSGKTSRLAHLLALFIKKGAHVKYASSILYHGQFAGIEVARGRQGDFSKVEEMIRWFVEAMDERKDKCFEIPGYSPFNEPTLVLALDEGSNYSSHVDQDLMGRLWDVASQDTRQMNACLIFCSHGMTLDMLGGKQALEGKRQTINEGVCWVKLSAVTDAKVNGNKRPCSVVEKGKVHGSSDWICEEKLVMPLDVTKPPENYDYRALVQEYCPQFMYPPA